MGKDPYKKSARYYDLFVEPFTKGLRQYGKRFYATEIGMHVLDVGCGTGNTLKMYSDEGCNVHGIDSSSAMLDEAKNKLGDNADLRLGSASNMEYSSEIFDLVTSMLSFHEMPNEIRPKVLEEMGRVVKKEGRMLLIDYHPASYRLQSGWIYKLIIYFFEIAAGFEHYRNFQNFLRNNGIQGLIQSGKLEVEKMRIVGGGNFGFYLLKRNI